jgi:hypothetical protein
MVLLPEAFELEELFPLSHPSMHPRKSGMKNALLRTAFMVE